MAVQPTTQQFELMDEVAAFARERVSGEDLDLVLAFVTGYYTGTSPDDLAERKTDDLYGAAAAHLNLARGARPGSRRFGSTTPGSSGTAGSRHIPSSRSSPTTCRSWSTRCAWC